MKRICVALVTPLLLVLSLPAPRAAEEKPAFRMQEIETGLGVGYCVLLVDVDGDGKKDIVVADKTRVVWYQNPTWKRRIITENKTKPDNVSIAAYDIDGDGKIDFALAGGWGNLQSKDVAPVYWLRRGKTLDDQWEAFPIAEEVCVHRIRFADLDGDGKPELIISPLLGKGSTQAKNWMDGEPVKTFAIKIPKDPVKDRWEPIVLDESMHVIHNVWPIPANGRKGMDLLTASYEGVGVLKPDGEKWKRTQLGNGNQDNPKNNRGASEIKMGHLKNSKFIATIEPWHGNQVVVYTPPEDPSQTQWVRHVVDESLKWGHAVWCADLDGDGEDELIIGVRDDLSMKPGERRGVRIYKATDGKGAKWSRTLIDEGGVAVEDLSVADLNGDGKLDIVAVGRQTHNIRIYWNEGKK
jgi:hypothetical protein